MPGNHVLLETIELTQTASSVTFDNIPQTGYTDLKIVASARTNRALEVDSAVLRFNGDTTSGNYSGRRFYGTGSGIASDTNPAGLFTTGATATSNVYGNSDVYIPNYTSNTAKSFSFDNSQESNATTSYMALQANFWTGTAAIYQIVLTPEVGTLFNIGSNFSLYGIAALGTTPTIAPKATGGNIVANDGTYWYHAFLTSGYFVPQTALTANCLVIGGGGGSGPDASSGQGSGGGAGGVFYATSQSLTATNYTVTVGAGGAAKAPNAGVRGDNGTNSQFGSLTAALGGGGGGPGNSSLSGASGGSGGGGGGGPTSGAGGSSTQTGTGGTGYGNSGAAGSNGQAGGGGGAGAAASLGNGGAGLNTWSAWASATGTGISGYYAGGGAGWAVGTPGAGNSGSVSGTASAANAPANVGGGGNGYVGAGGSGLVIIRYPMA